MVGLFKVDCVALETAENVVAAYYYFLGEVAYSAGVTGPDDGIWAAGLCKYTLDPCREDFGDGFSGESG